MLRMRNSPKDLKMSKNRIAKLIIEVIIRLFIL